MMVVYHIIVKEFLQIRRDRRMLVLSLMAPILQLVLLGYAATTDIRLLPMVVYDQDRSSEGRELVAQFTNSGYFELQGYAESSAEADRAIAEGKAWVALVIPPTYSGRLLARETAVVQLVVDGSDANSAAIGLGYASQIVARHSQSIAATILEEIPRFTLPGRVAAEARVWYNPDLKSRNFMIPGVVALVLMIITMTLTSIGIVKEREAGTMEQLLVTPIRPHELIIGKLLPFVIIAAVDVTLVLTVARVWFEVPMRGSIALLSALSGLFVLTTLGLGLFVSTISKTQQQAMMTAQFFIFMPFLFLSGFTFPIENMPEAVQYVTYLIPLRYFITIIRGIFLKGVGIAELWPEALALAAFGAGILALSVARFRKRLG